MNAIEEKESNIKESEVESEFLMNGLEYILGSDRSNSKSAGCVMPVATRKKTLAQVINVKEVNTDEE